MGRIITSFGHAVEGLRHAFRHERNLRLFTVGYALLLLLSTFLPLAAWEWTALILAGGLFFSVELLNTALERLTDAVDHARRSQGDSSLHAGLKATKDVAAASAFVSLCAAAAVIALVLIPHIKEAFPST